MLLTYDPRTLLPGDIVTLHASAGGAGIVIWDDIAPSAISNQVEVFGPRDVGLIVASEGLDYVMILCSGVGIGLARARYLTAVSGTDMPVFGEPNMRSTSVAEAEGHPVPGPVAT